MRKALLFVCSTICSTVLGGLPLAQRARDLSAYLPFANRVWHVDDDACPGPGAGTREAPFCSIQTAIDAAWSGDLVLVGPGDYPERLDYRGKDVAVVAAEGPAVTRMMRATFPSGEPPVGAVFRSGEGRRAVLDGFTIQGQTAAAAVLCDGASPTLRGNVLTGNQSRAIRVANGSCALFVGNRIDANYIGGGVEVFQASPTFVANTIRDNYILYYPGEGAGVNIVSSDVTLRDNLITGNDALYSGSGSENLGAGVYAYLSDVELTGNTFSDNFASYAMFRGGRGGGLAAIQCDLTLSRNVFWDNFASSAPELLLYQCTTTIDSCDIEGGLALIGLTGGSLVFSPDNVDVDPLFVDAASGDYHLSPSSPLVDAGPFGTFLGGTDLDGQPRVLDGDDDGTQRVDIGADEVGSVRLSVVGAATLGASIQLETAGPTGWTWILMGSGAPGDAAMAPFGSLLLAPAGLSTLGSGEFPGVVRFSVPVAAMLAGEELWLQSLGLAPGGAIGDTSRRVRVLFH